MIFARADFVNAIFNGQRLSAAAGQMVDVPTSLILRIGRRTAESSSG